MTVSVITDKWERIPSLPSPARSLQRLGRPLSRQQLSGDAKFKLDAPYQNIRYLVVNFKSGLPTEMEFYGTYKAVQNQKLLFLQRY